MAAINEIGLKIFQYSTGIDIDARQTLYRAVSTGGFVRTESGGPVFYYITSALRPMYRKEYKEVAAEIAARSPNGFDYGRETVTTRLPHGLTWAEGTAWDDTESKSGWHVSALNPDPNNSRVVTLAGLDDGSIDALDWIQFDSDSKVYQIVRSTSSSSGEADVELNADPISIDVNDGFVVGSKVEFKLLLQDVPGVNTVPGKGNPSDPASHALYTYSNGFTLREVL